VLFLSVISWERIKVWENGEVLFTDQLKKYPELPFALNNRGYLYYKYHKDYDKALKDYSRCIELDSTFHRALSNRGVLYFNTQNILRLYRISQMHLNTGLIIKML
jgi:lipoprotein NlpI